MTQPQQKHPHIKPPKKSLPPSAHKSFASTINQDFFNKKPKAKYKTK